MKKILILSSIIFSIISCQKDDYIGFRGTRSNFLELSFKGVNYKINGSIIFHSEEIDEVNSNGLSRKCTYYSTDYSHKNDDFVNDIMVRMTIPAYSNMIHDSLIGKKYPLEGGGCGYDYMGGKLFGLDLDIEIKDKWYPSRFDNDTSIFYNKITGIRYLGNYYDNPMKDVYEIQGEFKIDVVDQNISPQITYSINDGKYSVTIVTHKE